MIAPALFCAVLLSQLSPFEGTWTDGKHTLVLESSLTNLSGTLKAKGLRAPLQLSAIGSVAIGNIHMNDTYSLAQATLDRDDLVLVAPGLNLRLKKEAPPRQAAREDAPAQAPASNLPQYQFRADAQGWQTSLPSGWTGTTQNGLAVLWNPELPGIAITIGAAPGLTNDGARQALKQQLNMGFALLDPVSKPKALKLPAGSAFTADFSGIGNGQDLFARYVIVVGPHAGVGVASIGPKQQKQAISTASDSATRGLRFFAPSTPVAPPASDQNARLQGPRCGERGNASYKMTFDGRGGATWGSGGSYATTTNGVFTAGVVDNANNQYAGGSYQVQGEFVTVRRPNGAVLKCENMNRHTNSTFTTIKCDDDIYYTPCR